MKLCGRCSGVGMFNNDICVACDGEGVSSMTTFVVGKINRRKEKSYEEHQNSKEVKIDKKNATRGEY